MSNRKLTLILFSLTLILCPIFIYSSIIYTQENTNIFNPDIAVVLGSGTAGTSEIGVNGTSANVNVSATQTYYPSGYNTLNGTYVSGSVPASVQTVDANYFIVKSSGATSTTAYNPSSYGLLGSTTLVSGSTGDLVSDNSTYMTFRSYASGTATSYNPSSYSLLGSTTLASGSVSNLASNDGSYMTFNSYVSAFSTTSNSRAAIGYLSNTGSGTSYPKRQTWDGSAWSGESELATAGSPVRWVRVAYCPISSRYYERIMVTLSADGNLDAYVWNGTASLVTNNIGSVGITVNAYRAFDVQYEKTSGKGMLVYSMGGGAVDMQYKIWNGTAWSSANDLDLTGTASGTVVYWISLAQKPTAGANEIALICSEVTTSYAWAKIWSGSSWGNEKKFDYKALGAPQREAFAIVYEQSSGHAEAIITATNTREWSVEWNGATWGSDITTDFGGSAVTMWMTAKADPASDKIVVAVVDSSVRLQTQYWSGSAWDANPTVQDSSIDTSSSRGLDFAWEPTGSKGLLVYGTTAGSITYRTFTAPSTWVAATSTPMGSNTHVWVRLRMNPRSVSGDVKILGAVLEATANDLGAIKWNGITFTVIGASTFTADTSTSSYECFDFKFQEFGDPSEYTSEVEFTGTSTAALWTEVTWKVDSACTVASATVTLQLYNWNTPGYPGSGDGYISYTSSGTPNTDETQSQTITTNPTYYRETGTGNWKVKVKTVTSASFQSKIDWIQVRPGLEQYTSEVEFYGSSNTETWSQLEWKVDSAWTLGSVSVTIQVYDYTLGGVGGYPTSGDGYDSYTSNSSPNTDETRTQTVTTNPQNFRNATGYWQIKVKGVKNIATQFDFKADWVEYKPSCTQHTVSTEFTFSGMVSDTPTQLNFTVVSEYNTTSVSVTIQVWNYSSSPQAYVTSGEGYLTYTSSGSNETKLLSINTNPQHYVSSGNAKIKVTGQKTTITQYQQKTNQIELKCKAAYDYILSVTSQKAYNQNITLNLYNYSNINRLSNCTIWFHDGTQSIQITITNGVVTQNVGPTYSLPTDAPRYIAVYAEQSASGTSTLFIELEAVKQNSIVYSCLIELGVS